MQMHDRVLLAKLMAIQNASQRDVAEAAGYSSHTFIGRLLKGEVTSLKPEPAVRIANFFGVPLESLFVPRVSANQGRSVPSKRRKNPAARERVA
jgi:transcriptional regulator with XRE-family HTH domain